MTETSPGLLAAGTPSRVPLDARTLPRRRPSRIFRNWAAQPPPKKKRRDLALIACFLLAISLPLVGLVLSLDSAFLLDENRVLASRPELKLDRSILAEFPAKFEAYFNDQFGFRKRLIHWLSFVKVAALGVSPSPKVILGRNGWLFYGDSDIPYYRAVKPFTPSQLEAWRMRLEQRQEWLSARGIPYLIVFAPLKSTIYPEFMPRAYNRVGTVSRLDQLMAHLAAHSNLTVIDLRAPILEEKARHQIYYRTDTHWNNRGAYVGYREIMTVLGRWLPQIETIPISAFVESDYSEPGGDLPLLLGMRPFFREHYVDLRKIKKSLAGEVQPGPPAGKLWTRGPDMLFQHPDERLPRAVMFRDSYATWLIPLLSESFSHILYSWQYTFNYDIVERERPAVVIQEMVERALLSGSPPLQ